MIMKTVVVTALILFLCLLITPVTSKERKRKCYKVYNKVKHSCRQALKGRYTATDCCSKPGGSAYKVKKGGKRTCTPCKKNISPPENWSSWGKWSIKCDVKCGEGLVRRTRKCGHIKNVGCPGKSYESKKCIHPTVPNCPVHGGWSNYGNWTACSVTCGKGQQLRFRSCTNPKPQFGGKKCVGTREEKGDCKDLPHCPIHGGWGKWEPWSSCSVTCSIGVQQRVRKCDNPKPKYSGRECDPTEASAKRSCDTYKDCDDSSGSGSASGSGTSSGSGSSSGEGNDSEGGDDSDSGSSKSVGSGSGNGKDAAGKKRGKSKKKNPGKIVLADKHVKPTKKSGGDFHFAGNKKKKAPKK